MKSTINFGLDRYIQHIVVANIGQCDFSLYLVDSHVFRRAKASLWEQSPRKGQSLDLTQKHSLR